MEHAFDRSEPGPTHADDRTEPHADHSPLEASSPRELLKPIWPINHVRTERQLTQLVGKLNRADIFSVDTETWGPRVLSDKLCLIQISIPASELGRRKNSAGGETYLVDVVALEAIATTEGKGRNPLLPLKKVLEDDTKTKVIHHAQFERGQFEKYGIDLDGVVDTKNVAKRIRPDLVSHSLQACVYEILGQEMSKEEQTSKWIQRPLTESQIEYAALDSEVVLHLLTKLRALEKETTPKAEWKLDTLLKELGETRRARRELFDGEGIQLAMRVLDEIIDKNRTALTETLKYEAEKGVVANYRGAYGVAMYKRFPLEEVSLTTLHELVPNLVPAVVRETTSKKAVADALKDLGRKDELDDIWEEINVTTDERTAPKLVIELAGEPKTTRAAPKKKTAPPGGELPPPPEISKEEAMHTILEAEIGKLQVIRNNGLGDRLAILEGRIARYAERILELLEETAVDPSGSSHAGPYGTAAFTTREIKTLDIEHLRAAYPEVAERCLTPVITKGRLTTALRDSGADPATAEKIVAQIFRKTEELSSPRIYIVPNYALFYKGVELDPEVEASDDDGDFDEPI